MNVNDILTFTIVLATVFAYINHKLIKWPPTIGIMVLSLISSVILAALGRYFPLLSDKAKELASSIDFHDILMNFMLSCLRGQFTLTPRN